MSVPTIAVAAQAVKRIRNHDCWVFRDELLRPDGAVPLDSARGAALSKVEWAVQPGDVVEVVDPRGAFVAYAFANPVSHIALRVVSTSREVPVDRGLVEARLTRAIARRAALAGTNARRLVFSEADALPGLIVDQYADSLVLQIRSAGMERFRAAIVEGLQRQLAPKGILERSDKEFREDEGLPPVTEVLAGEVPGRILIEEDGLKFWVDPHRGLKTGFYLDQRTTRRRLRGVMRSGAQVLDAFSYTGSLGIVAAAQGAQVVCVEAQEPFVELARENAKLNGVERRLEFVAGDAFYWLDAKTHEAARWDWVLLDPPALAKAKPGILKARQALHHLLVRAFALAKDDGQVLLSLCTYHLLNLVEEIARIAAGEEGCRVQVRDQWLQAEDHPWILQVPPTRYLTSWLFARDARSAAWPTSTRR
ncbi:MAG: class I SAM-dependent rRNA methyltransferase [Candidatus Omnitrophica bacterium]|nr:class I SAM-dependent rRNA methyltransferase [Candidatus Omnitrophota bacterium]